MFLKNLPNDAVGTLAKFLSDSVLFINDEILIEDLEDFSIWKVSHFPRGALRNEDSGSLRDPSETD